METEESGSSKENKRKVAKEEKKVSEKGNKRG
jgi:hypothetical protein